MEEKSKGLGIFVKILTGAFATALLAFVIFFSIQLYRSTIFDLYKDVYLTDSFYEAYDNNNDVRTHSVGTEGLSENGVIKVTELIYIEELGENGEKTGDGYIQFGVRINKLHVEELQESCPGVDYDDVEFFLVAQTAEGKTEYNLMPSLLDSGEKYQYKYYKVEMEDVHLGADTLTLEMRINGITVVEEDGDKVILEQEGAVHTADSSVVHKKDRTSIEYKFSRKEKNKIEEREQ